MKVNLNEEGILEENDPQTEKWRMVCIKGRCKEKRQRERERERERERDLKWKLKTKENKFGLVLWHTKDCWLFNAKSIIYIYIYIYI